MVSTMRGYFSQRLIGYLVLLASLLTQAVSLWETSSPGTNSNPKTCDELRAEIAQRFRQNIQQVDPKQSVDQFIPLWVELALPKACGGMSGQSFNAFNPSSTQDTGGPLGTMGTSGTIYTQSMKTRKKREAHEAADHAIAPANQERSKREMMDDVTNSATDSKALNREKRFLHGMSLGGSYGGPSGSKKEVSESAQMMNMLLMLSKLQKSRFNAEMGRMDSNRNSFYGERASFGGLYGNQYMGRKKREAPSPATEASISNAAGEAVDLVRRKRFVSTEPGDAPAGGASPMSQLMGIMMGTARDPNTGKRLDFGGDAMKDMMRTGFINTLPGSARPPAGKEPGDFVKNMAPLWYFSRFQRSMNPPVYRMKDMGNYPMRTFGPIKRRNKDGTFGDPYPAGRKKRSADDNSDSNSNNDVLTIGDVSIPLDFFKPPEQSETPPPPATPWPMYYPVYYPQPRMTRPMQYRPFMGAMRQSPVTPMRRGINSLAAPIRGYYPNHFAPNHFAPTPYSPPITPQQLTPTIHHPKNHRRMKRAAESSDGSSNNDVLTVGDISIPMDFFKPSDDYPRRQPPPTRYVPVYRPMYVNRYWPYHQRQTARYPAQYYRQYAQAAQNWQRTNQVYSQPQAGYWNTPRNPVPRAVQPPTPVNQWARPAPPVNPWAQPPPTPVNRWTPPPARPTHQWPQPAPQPPTFQAPPPQRPLTSSAPQQPPNPFLPPAPPTPPQHVPSSHRRVKRSDNNDKTDSTPSFSDNTIFPLIFPPVPMTPSWFSPRFTSPAKIMVSNSPATGAIYGDALPWNAQGRSNFVPPSFYQPSLTPAAGLLSLASSLRRPASGMGPLDMFYGTTPPRRTPLTQNMMPQNSISPLPALNKNPYSFGAMPPGQSFFSPTWSSQTNMIRPFSPVSSLRQIHPGASPLMHRSQPMLPQPQANPLHLNAAIPKASLIGPQLQPAAQSPMFLPPGPVLPGALPPQNPPIVQAVSPQNPPIAPAVPPQNPPIAPAVPPQNPPVAPAVPPQNPPVAPAIPPQNPPVAPAVPPQNQPIAPPQPMAAQPPTQPLSPLSSGAGPARDTAFPPPPLPASHPSPFLPPVW